MSKLSLPTSSEKSISIFFSKYHMMWYFKTQLHLCAVVSSWTSYLTWPSGSLGFLVYKTRGRMLENVPDNVRSE